MDHAEERELENGLKIRLVARERVEDFVVEEFDFFDLPEFSEQFWAQSMT
jgi:hypothetical protein